MRKIAFITVISLSIFTSCINSDQKRIIESVNRYLQGQADYFRFNGNVLISEKGKIVYHKSFGFSDFDKQLPLNDSSVFELASVSKQFTAMGILMLEKQGLIDLSGTPVRDDKATMGVQLRNHQEGDLPASCRHLVYTLIDL